MKNPLKIQISPQLMKIIQEMAEKKKLQQSKTNKGKN